MTHNGIGGYLPLELSRGSDYYPLSIKLNSGRNCLRYILDAYEYRKIYLPHYSCNALLEPLMNKGIDFEFYGINNDFSPKFKKKLENDSAMIIINYFGLQVKNNVRNRDENIIIDNSQAFYLEPVQGVPTFYSPRKFFGVPDGGYLFCDKKILLPDKRDVSHHRTMHLILRADGNTEDGYGYYKTHENGFTLIPLKQMSTLTRSILKSISYDEISEIRRVNFLYLHKALSAENELLIDQKNIYGPMAYPLLRKNGKVLKEKLLKNDVFIATYWPEVLGRTNQNDFEYYLTENLLALPVDQRYTHSDMEKIVSLLT